MWFLTVVRCLTISFFKQVSRGLHGLSLSPSLPFWTLQQQEGKRLQILCLEWGNQINNFCWIVKDKEEICKGPLCFLKTHFSLHHNTKVFHLIWNDNNQASSLFFFSWPFYILSLFYPVFLNFSGDFRYGFPLSSSPQFKLSLHAFGKLELSPSQIAVVHFPIEGVLLQNDIWLSADHQTLLVMEQNKDWWVPNPWHRQKNAFVDHDRSRWLRRPGGLCVTVHRTVLQWNALGLKG